MELNFDKVYKLIKTYITFVVKCETKINEYVPNVHIAMTFKDVLKACELECLYPDVYHNVRESDELGGADYVIPERRHLYDYKDGKYYSKRIYKISFVEVIEDYFDMKRLLENGEEEVHRTYQKLCEREDYIRNNLKLIDIVIPIECNMVHKVKNDLRTDKIKLNY